MAKWADVPVINGLTDLCHPCQVLADLFTIWEEKKELTNLKIAWIGDGFNMANSWLNAAIVMNLNLWMACPKGYEPNSKILSEAKKKAQVKFFHQPKEVIEKAEVINTDVWTSMGQEKEIEKRKRDFQGFTLDKELVSSASPSHIILHCLPAHRGEEITEEILEGPNSKIFEQAENRLHIQKALLEWLLS
jgi:ornithine carbamoyltransferase